MPIQPPDNVWDRLLRAMRAVDPAGDPYGAHQLQIGGTVNILGGGSGGTAQADDSAFVPTSSSLTPAGAYVGGRQVASGHVGAPAMSASAILQVHVVAGGAGGGIANLNIRGTTNNDVYVGVASGPAGAAGNWNLPVVLGSGHIAPVSERASTRPAATTMQNAATADGNGTNLDVEGYATAILHVTQPSAADATLIWEASVDDATWTGVYAHLAGSLLQDTSGAGALMVGDWVISCAGFKSIRARIADYVSGSITVKGYALVQATPPGVQYVNGAVSVSNTVFNPLNVTPAASFTVNLGNIPTVNVGAMPGLVGSVRATNLGGSVGVIGAGGSLGAVNLGGSVGVSPIGDFTVWVANPAAGGSGFATVGVYGSVGVTGSVRVTPAGDFTVWLANAAAGGSALGTVGVYGSVQVTGSVNVTPVASFTVNLASHIDTAGSAVRVNVVAGGAGGGVAQMQVQGTSGAYAGVGYASGPGDPRSGPDGHFALPVLYASGFYATVNVGVMPALVGSVWATNLGGSVGVLGLGGSFPVVGSVNVTPVATFTVALDKVATVNLGLGTVNIGNGVVGSVNVTPVASFTVNLGSIPTVNIGLGTVNIGNVPQVTVGGVAVVDTRGSLVPTQWLISMGGSGYSTIVPAGGGSVKARLYSIMLVNVGTCDISFQSPSGTFLTGSLRILPGAGFAAQTQLANPVLVGGANATLFIHATGSQNIGGWVAGWLE